jgi:hypothetical protein
MTKRMNAYDALPFLAIRERHLVPKSVKFKNAKHEGNSLWPDWSLRALRCLRAIETPGHDEYIYSKKDINNK